MSLDKSPEPVRPMIGAGRHPACAGRDKIAIKSKPRERENRARRIMRDKSKENGFDAAADDHVAACDLQF